MERKILNALLACPLFAGLSEIEIELTLSGIRHNIVRLEAHDVYALAGMPCKHVDIIVSGELICRMSSFSGKQVEVSKLRKGNMIAPAFIFANDNKLPVSVETESEATIFRMPPDGLKTLIDSDEKIRMNYIRVLSNIDVFLTHKLKVLSLFTVREKVAYMLLERAGEQGTNKVHLTRSRKEIAASFGIQKFSLLRVLSDFEKEGAIEINGKDITILDRRKMLK